VDAQTLIRGGRVVSAYSVVHADVLIEGERIAAVGTVSASDSARVIDAEGKLVLPGGVDVHTHLDMEVGVTRSSDDFFTGTRAAAAGGTTTVVDFATAYRGESLAHGLANWHAKAEGKAIVDYGFHMSITELNGSASDAVAEMGEAGISSFKLYMTYPDRLMVSDEVILQVLRAAGDAGALVCLHCEDDAAIARLRSEALGLGHTGPRWHAWSRPPGAESEAVGRAVRMAEEAAASCYVVHLSSAQALAQVRAARERGLPFFAETCHHYLYLSAERYVEVPRVAARYVCAPPLRDPWHQEELWAGLAAGHLQVVATDHCPFDSSSKDAGLCGGGGGTTLRFQAAWRASRPGLLSSIKRSWKESSRSSGGWTAAARPPPSSSASTPARESSRRGPTPTWSYSTPAWSALLFRSGCTAASTIRSTRTSSCADGRPS
jgi:dihydropyrimidinase